MSSGSGKVVKKDLPNTRVYELKGRFTFRCWYVIFVVTALVELAGIVLWFPLGIEPCDAKYQTGACAEIESLGYSDTLQCGDKPFNGVWDPPHWYRRSAGIETVQCFKQPQVGDWGAYLLFCVAECLSISFGLMFYLGLWRPIRRGARYLRDFQPHFPPEKWPTVDIMLCHYSEPAEDTIATLETIMKLDYPPHLFHVWICDDGYCKSKWEAGAQVPEVSVNTGVIEKAGDVRHEIAKFMYHRVCKSHQVEVDEWRKEHTTIKMPMNEKPRIVQRADCGLGSIRDDYHYDGLPKLTFVGRVKPAVHHSKAGNINNVLYNEGACGRYAIILDNDMKPHEMFIQATLPFFFEGVSTDEYSDHVSVNQVGYVQTPQYFKDCNSTVFDTAQAGMDGYDCASFAGTNSIFRREALDSVLGIQYGSLTEDALTGTLMIDNGWKGYFFRKDLDLGGDEADRIRLSEGAEADSVSAALEQRKRWAMGNFQIYLRNKESLVDPEWTPPQVELPPKREINKFMRWVFFMNLTVYPIGFLPPIFYFYLTGYFLFTGQAPIYASGLRLLMALVPKLVAQSMLSVLSNRMLDNDDVLCTQETWFSYSFAHAIAVYETFYWKITGKEAAWVNTGAHGGGNSMMELPNVLVFMTMLFGMMWRTVRYFADYKAVTTHDTALYFASLFLGGFVACQLAPMVRMSVQTYFGWSQKNMTDQNNIVGSLSLAFVLVLLCIWVETPNHSILG